MNSTDIAAALEALEKCRAALGALATRGCDHEGGAKVCADREAELAHYCPYCFAAAAISETPDPKQP